MATNFSEKNNKQKYLVILLVVVVLVTFFILRKDIFKRFSTSSPKVEVFSAKNISINFEILKNPIIKDLQSVSKINPFVGKSGRENPFISY
jgi:hypothetical protein